VEHETRNSNGEISEAYHTVSASGMALHVLTCNSAIKILTPVVVVFSFCANCGPTEVWFQCYGTATQLTQFLVFILHKLEFIVTCNHLKRFICITAK
jgi:hypothetical protein